MICHPYGQALADSATTSIGPVVDPTAIVDEVMGPAVHVIIFAIVAIMLIGNLPCESHSSRMIENLSRLISLTCNLVGLYYML